MTSKHTPGPWRALPEEANKPYVRIRGTCLGERYEIANVLAPAYDDAPPREAEETRANARLIAAAPELLEELEYARTTLSLLRTDVARSAKVDHRWEGMDEKFAEWLGRIDAAIAKARGETC